ncbi:hypothetical protein, partial [Pseudomonas syringae]|uniref:hypothetical protein n=1 Tax=Pseudomonas syringae TaxID=317 RepID=UPI0034D71D30
AYLSLGLSEIHPVLQSIPGRTEEFYKYYLLADQNPMATFKAAGFWAIAFTCRQKGSPQT